MYGTFNLVMLYIKWIDKNAYTACSVHLILIRLAAQLYYFELQNYFFYKIFLFGF